MTPVFALRLCLDLLSGGLLVFGLSFWWLGDGPHEATGLALFVLITVHNVFNRRRYWNTARGRLDAARTFSIGATIILALAAVLLAATSAAITTVAPDWLPPTGGAVAKRLHGWAAYWMFAAVAVHLGLRWPMLMALARRTFGIVGTDRRRTLALRLLVASVAMAGARSFTTLGIGDRLMMRMSLDWWDFDSSVLGFFGHCAAIAALLIAASFYTTRMFRVACTHEQQS